MSDVTLSPLDAAARFAVMIDALRVVVRGRLAFLGVFIGGAINNWLGRTARRFERLMARVAAGEDLTPRPRVRPAGEVVRRERVEPEYSAEARLCWSIVPRTRAWLLLRLKHEAAYTTQALERFLAEPGMQELLIRSGGMRYIRPLARLVGSVLPPALRAQGLAPRKKRVRAVSRGPSVAEQKAALWYPNVEGKPINLWLASKKMGRGE